MFFFFFSQLSCFWILATPWIAALQDFQSFSISQSLLNLMSIVSMMPSNHLIPMLSHSPPALNLSQRQGHF